MKRKELIKKITSIGCELARHGGRHDLYRNTKTGKKQPVPRHDEYNGPRNLDSMLSYTRV